MNEKDVYTTYRRLAHKSPVELRIFPKNGHPIVETVTTEQAFIEACKRWDGKAQIYCGLRERRAGFQDDKQKGKGGDANDIVAVTTTVVDVDPIRAEGFAKQAAKDSELACAIIASEHLARWHEGRGFLRPARAMSGNGVQLWFPIPRWEVTDATLGSGISRKYLSGHRVEMNVRSSTCKTECEDDGYFDEEPLHHFYIVTPKSSRFETLSIMLGKSDAIRTSQASHSLLKLCHPRVSTLTAGLLASRRSMYLAIVRQFIPWTAW